LVEISGGTLMGVNNPHHGSLRHEDLRIGADVTPDGEKPRPNYLGSVLDLEAVAELPASSETNRSI
jgi:hypothetical protein